MSRIKNVEINGGDLVLVVLCIAQAWIDRPHWLIMAVILIVSWVWCPRWSRKDGWRFWR